MFKAKLVMPKRTRRMNQMAIPTCNDCCKRTKADITESYIFYRYVAEPSLKRQSSIVGGHRVPYFHHHVNQVRQKRKYLDALSPIDETPFECEKCHSDRFSNLSNTKHVTLRQARCTYSLHSTFKQSLTMQTLHV